MKLRLKELREDSDIKQKEMADILDCGQSCYSKWELQKTDIPNEILIKLAKFFNTSTDYILGITNIREPYPPSKK